jgi:hypothetical protein
LDTLSERGNKDKINVLQYELDEATMKEPGELV